MSSYVNGIKPMKRHQSRLAPTVLTLSLLGAASLLTACGGGGGGAPAEAAPAAPSTPSEPVKPPEPALTDYSSPDEPYLVAQSSFSADGKTAYQLNVLDGRSQTKVLSVASTEAFTGKWTVIDRISRTLDTTDGGKQYIEKMQGGRTLVYIATVEGKQRLFTIDLTRIAYSTPPQPEALADVTNACAITGSHLIKRDGSEAAVYVTTPGADLECGNSQSADATVKAQATDNPTWIVKLAGSATERAASKAVTPLVTFNQIVSFIYKNGTLTGALAQTGSASATRLQVLSPTLDKVLNKTPIVIGTTETYETAEKNPALGVEWIASEPGETGAGYLRLQTFSKATLKYTNAVHKLSWDEATESATVSAKLLGSESTVGSLTNRGLNDSKYVYFVDGQLVYYGPTSNASRPFTAFAQLKDFVPGIGNKAYLSMQTDKHLIVRTEGTLNAAFSVKKDPVLANQAVIPLFTNTSITTTQVPLGIWTQVTTSGTTTSKTTYLISRQVQEGFDDRNFGQYSLKRTDISTGYGDFLNDVNRINVLGAVWSPLSTNGQRELLSAIVCPKTADKDSKGDCSSVGDEMKTVDFAKKTFGVLVGKPSTILGQDMSVVGKDFYLGINASVQISRVLAGGIETYEDPWLFNSQFKNSLTLVSTFPAAPN